MSSDIDNIFLGLYSQSYTATEEHSKGNIGEAMRLYAENIARTSQCAEFASDADRYRFLEFLVLAYTRRGLSYRRAGDVDSALADFNHAIDVVASGQTKRIMTDVYFYRANALIAKGDPEKARESYRQFLSGKPQGTFGEGFGLHADFSLWLPANVQLLLADCDRAVDANPRFAEALFGRGVVKQYKGDLSAAQADFEVAKAAAPNDLLIKSAFAAQQSELDAMQRQAKEKIRPTDPSHKKDLRPDIDYCSVNIALDGQGYIELDFYGVDGERSESRDGQPYKTVLNDLRAEGWQEMTSVSHQEGARYYFQRRKKS